MGRRLARGGSGEICPVRSAFVADGILYRKPLIEYNSLIGKAESSQNLSNVGDALCGIDLAGLKWLYIAYFYHAGHNYSPESQA